MALTEEQLLALFDKALANQSSLLYTHVRAIMKPMVKQEVKEIVDEAVELKFKEIDQKFKEKTDALTEIENKIASQEHHLLKKIDQLGGISEEKERAVEIVNR